MVCFDSKTQHRTAYNITAQHRHAVLHNCEGSCRDASEKECQHMSAPVRDYQQRLVEAAKTGNHIIVLPTGSGKTRIAIELTRQLLSGDSAKRVVFLTPTVTLAQQQTGKYLTCAMRLCCVLQLSMHTKHYPWGM